MVNLTCLISLSSMCVCVPPFLMLLWANAQMVPINNVGTFGQVPSGWYVLGT